MDDKVLPLFGRQDSIAQAAEPKSQAADWEICMASGELIKMNGHIVLNGMMVAILEDPDDSFSLKFYAGVDTVEYVKRV